MNTNVGITQQALEMDSGEKRLHELGYKQELRREMVCLKPSHISKVIYANLVLNHISYFYVGSRKEYLTLLIYAFFFFFFFWVSSDSIQDACNNIFKHSSFLWNTTIWPKPTLCWSRKLNMGMGGSHIFHLVCWTSLGWDMLLLPSMFPFCYIYIYFFSLITPCTNGLFESLPFLVSFRSTISNTRTQMYWL